MVTISFGKSEGLFFGVIIFVFVVVGFAIAFNPTGTGGIPSEMGHSMDEIEIPICDDGQILEYSGGSLVCKDVVDVVDTSVGSTIGGGYQGTYDGRADCSKEWGVMSQVKGSCQPNQTPLRSCRYYCTCSEGTLRDTNLNEISDPIAENVEGNYYICTSS